jgi:hypothetical protein
MKQVLALGLAVLLSLAAPAFAQTSNSGSTTQTNRAPSSDNALTAQNQSPPPPADSSGLLLGGGAVLGTFVLIGILASHKSDNGPISP